MKAITLDQLNKNPEQWLLKLDQFNMRLATNGGAGIDYSKNDTQMIYNIIIKLPKCHYRHFTTVYEIGGMLSLSWGSYQDKV